MRALAMVVALVAALFLAPSTAAAWSAGAYDSGAEQTLASLINGEHHRVCGSSLLRAYQHNNLDRWRARDMVERDYFSHTILGTSNKAWDYFAKYGIRDWRGAGEIIVWNSYPDDMSAAEAFTQFMGSDGHRALIQACAYNTFGVGAYKGSDGKRMYAVTFSVQPIRHVSWWRAPVRAGPSASTARRFYAYRGARVEVFRHAYDSRGRRWDYVHVDGKGWGWLRHSKTR